MWTTENELYLGGYSSVLFSFYKHSLKYPPVVLSLQLGNSDISYVKHNIYIGVCNKGQPGISEFSANLILSWSGICISISYCCILPTYPANVSCRTRNRDKTPSRVGGGRAQTGRTRHRDEMPSRVGEGERRKAEQSREPRKRLGVIAAQAEPLRRTVTQAKPLRRVATQGGSTVPGDPWRWQHHPGDLHRWQHRPGDLRWQPHHPKGLRL